MCFVSCRIYSRKGYFLTLSCNIDVPNAVADNNINRRDTNVSHSRRLWIVHYVRYSALPFSLFSLWDRCCFSSHESAPGSGHKGPRTRGTPAAPPTLTHLEVAVHRTYEEHRKSPMNHGCPSVSMGMDEQLQDKPGVLILDDNREIRMES